MAKQSPKHSEMTNLKIMRIRRGLTQKQLAEKVGIEFHAISAYENGWRFPRRDILDRLAEKLECEVKDIV